MKIIDGAFSLAQFEKFQKGWEIVICLLISFVYLFHLFTYFICLLTSFVYLLIILCTLNAKFQKNACLRSCWWCKIGVKWSICPNQQHGPLLETSYYIPLLSILTLHWSWLKFRRYETALPSVDRNQLHRGIHTPKLITKLDFF